MNKKYRWPIVIGVLIVALLAFNFLNFHAARSSTNSDFSLGTGHTGETLPQNMANGFRLSYQVTGSARLNEPLQQALQAELAALPNVIAAELIPAGESTAQANPLIRVEVSQTDYLWTPFYARSTVTAVVFFASDGEISWLPGETLVFETSPAIKAEGEFRLADSSWGLIAKPAYAHHLSQELAKSIAAGLQSDALTLSADQ